MKSHPLGKSSAKAGFASLSRGKHQCPPFCTPRSISSWGSGADARAGFSATVPAATEPRSPFRGAAAPSRRATGTLLPGPHRTPRPAQPSLGGGEGFCWGQGGGGGGGEQLRCWEHWEQLSPRLPARSQRSRSSAPSETRTRTPGRIQLATAAPLAELRWSTKLRFIRSGASKAPEKNYLLETR